jgi:hypothetical protein
METLRAEGHFTPPTLDQLEEALERCLDLGGGIVTADLWDVRRFASCAQCADERLARLARMNFTSVSAPRTACAACGWS